MAMADSVPGVSGGTIAFLLGFYDEFINSLNDLMGKDNARRKQAFFFLFKLGVGWVAGFCLSVLVLSGLFQEHIYEISSVFMGLTFFAVPMVIREEKDSIRGRYGNLVFTVLGIGLVFCISYFNPAGGQGMNVSVEPLSMGLVGICFPYCLGSHHRHGAARHFRFHAASHIRYLCAHYRGREGTASHEPELRTHTVGVWHGCHHRNRGNHKNH